jgi:hypothetical protein
MGFFDFLKSKKTIDNLVNENEKENIDYSLGNLITLEEHTIQDMISNPVFVNDLTGEDENDKFDETSVRPILDSVNVNRKLAKTFFEVSILAKIIDSEIFCSVNYQEDGKFSLLYPWKDGQWIEARFAFPNKKHITLLAIPEIEGKSNVQIEYNIVDDIGSIKS